MQSQRLDILKSRVQERLDALDLDPQGASRKAGLGLSYVGDLLADRLERPSEHNISRVADALRCKVSWLCGDDVLGESEARAALRAQAQRLILPMCRDADHAALIVDAVMTVFKDAEGR